MKEIFRTIDNCPDFMVSNMGRVKSLKLGKEKILSQWVTRRGYMSVPISDKNGYRKQYSVHRLVAQAFIPNPNNLPEVNHKDENKTNNIIWVNEDNSIDYNKSNLEWCDRKYNMNYGTTKERIGQGNSKSVIQYSKEGILIRKWDSATEAKKEYNISHIIECCKGTYKSAGGYVWKYYDKETYLIGIMNNNFKYAA